MSQKLPFNTRKKLRKLRLEAVVGKLTKQEKAQERAREREGRKVDSAFAGLGEQP